MKSWKERENIKEKHQAAALAFVRLSLAPALYRFKGKNKGGRGRGGGELRSPSYLKQKVVDEKEATYTK